MANARRAIAAVVAVLAAIYGTVVLWSVVEILFLVPRSGSGFVGGVSSGVADPVGLLGVALFATSIVANRRLAGWVRRQPPAVAALHRGQTIALLIMAGAIALFVLLAARGLMSDFRLGIAIALLAEVALAAQWLLLAPILTIFAIRAPSSAT
jgi:hypothetical protein